MAGTPDPPDRPRVGPGAAPWLVFAIASAGWVFDVYEGQLFAVFKGPMLRELLGGSPGAELTESLRGRIDWHSNVALALFLVGGAAGGLGFGMLADRIGRVRTMGVTILVYSVFSALTCFVRESWQMHALRFLVAIGVGGEWAIAAALVAESVPTRWRAWAGGAFHASSVIGLVLASATGWLFAGPDQWRWAFLIGLAPALLVLWIRLSLREPDRWQRSSAGPDDGPETTPAAGSLRELLGDPRWRPRALIGLGLAAVGLGTYWGVFAFAPELVKEVLPDTLTDAEKQARASQVYSLITLTGSAAGLLAFAPLASTLGRRATFLIYHAGALVLVPAAFLAASSLASTVLLLALMAAFVVGMHAGYAIYFPELFPTRLRATGTSFCFNVGRVLGAVMLLVRGWLGATIGVRPAVAVVSLVFLVGIGLLAFAPETKGTELPD
ncbi:MFS transporter [Tautonia sociabilis]|uniref:MFS transporter n=1 Tax=Tautonia sociabilis TaxID=2080755 RepID=A0A432MI73_9BACT|nr:MFS transporter [Tautonia sociabilis]RUL87052.1 MFS transporter [Tautonia sociabilis]